MTAKPMDAELRAIFNAITVSGVRPDYHQQQIDRLKKEWPVLWLALNEFVRSVDREIIAGRLK